jgi:alkanesulfonate monooxygenase SsuD/methylene tetrahydromethanopterin reductase-like flavin-dependent oxidoreductase (luciferase family)
MRFAVNIPPFTDPAAVLAIGRDAEAAGWDGVFLWDHLRWDPVHPPEVHDPWVLLGALAQATERVLLGTSVTPLSRRRPWVVAKQLMTLDHLSGGRAVLGVGLGEPPGADFADFGDEADPRVRAAILDEGLDIVDQLLTTGHCTHHGTHFQVEAAFRPGPVQRPRPPVWVAGVLPNRRPLRRARTWEGVVPIGEGDLLTPQALADYLAGDVPEGWDVVASRAPGFSPSEYADAGATWLVDSTWPVGDWVGEFHERVRRGPSTT